MLDEILAEKRILTNIRLTDHQKAVLTRVKIAQSPRIATDNTKKNTSMDAAREQMIRLGLIAFDGTNTTITPQGEQLLKDESLIDDMGELTPDGQEAAYDDKDQPQAGQDQPPQDDQMGMDGEQPPAAGGQDMSIPPSLQGESFSLIRSLGKS